VNLREAGVSEERAAPVGAPDGGGVRALGVGREIVDIAVAARGENDRIAQLHRKLAGDQVAGDDAARLAVDHNQVQHLRTRVHLHLAGVDLPLQCLIGAQQKLLAGLSASIEGARDLRATKGAILERTAVFTSEGNSLRDALVDDVDAVLREAVDVAFAGAEVATLHCVIEEAVDAVTVILIIFGGVDAALGGDRVRAAGRILKAEALDVVAQLAEGCGGGGAGQARPHDDDIVAALVGWIDQLHFETCVVPGLFDGSGWNACIQFHRAHYLTHPARTLIGIEM
jgi:hypothetical protein